jgi:hypothetical protein
MVIKRQIGAFRGPIFLALMADELHHFKGDAMLVI